MKSLYTLSVLLLSVSLLQAQPINSMLIDDFSTGPVTAPDWVLDNQGVWASLNAGPSVLGQYRIIGNYLTEVLPGSIQNATVVSSSKFSIDNSAVTRSVGQVIWQGSSITPGASPIIANPNGFNLGSLNLDTALSTPNFNFQWSVVNADDRNWEYTIRAYTTNAANYFEAMLSSNQSSVTLSIPRSAFVATGSPDWSNIDAITFAATHNDGLLGGDLAIDNVMLAVPEVSSYLMIGATAAVVGVYYAFRRRKEGSWASKSSVLA